MPMTKLTLACGLIITLAACASNPPPASTATGAPAAGTQAAATQATAQAAKPKLICDEEKPLGSLLPQRICMTPEEAAQRRKAARDAMTNIRDQSAVGPGAGSSSGG